MLCLSNSFLPFLLCRCIDTYGFVEWYSHPRATHCDACDVGTFSGRGASNCTDCNPGKFNPYMNQTKVMFAEPGIPYNSPTTKVRISRKPC